MSKTLNKVEIEGYVGNKPEYRMTKDNEEVATFVIGTEDFLFNDTKKQWHTVVVIGAELVRKVKEEIDKGITARIKGTLYTYKDDKKFVHRILTEIIVTDLGSIEILQTEISPAVSRYYD